MNTSAIDLFAGLGGFDLALRELGIDPLGVEWDDAACRTREACGLRTLQADVSMLNPLDFAPVEGLVGGPPCPAFSMAGKGEGRAAIPYYVDALERMGRGEQIDRAEMDEACGDERAHLVLEPLRWALALEPRWIVLEQVPPVLPLWEAMCGVLRSRGYSTWCGVLSAEQFGVPQTRKRAFLIASLDGPVSAPVPTHQRYIAPRRRDEDADALFAPPEPQRIVAPEDRELLPWVSMAEALGWDRGDRIGFPRRNDLDTPDEYRERDLRPASEPSFALTEKARSSLRFVNNSRDKSAVRDADEPAPTITGGHDHNERRWVLRTGNNTMRTSRNAEDMVPQERPITDPAPTVDTKVGTAWKVAPEGEHVDPPMKWKLRSGQSVAGEGRAERDADAPSLAVTGRFDLCQWVASGDASPCGCPWDYVDADGFCACCHAHLDDPAGLYAEQGDGTHNLRGCPHFAADWTGDRPAPTIVGTRRSDEGIVVGRQLPPGEGRNVGGHGWVDTRPATTIAGDPRVHPPGHKVNADDLAAGRDDYDGRAGQNAVRVSLAEALVLQGFDPATPVQGTKSKQFEQVGNAVPPALAHAALVVVAARQDVAA